MIRPNHARILFAMTIALASASACFDSARAAAPEPAFQEAFQRFVAAGNGDAGAIEQSADAFDALLKADPENPVLMAYAGASTSMKARTTMLPWKKMGYADDGLALIDKSLAMLGPQQDAPIQRGTPGSLETRFVASNTFLAVPGFMNRSARGAKLQNDVLTSPLFAASPLPFKGAVWMRAAALAAKEQRTQDAKHYLDEIVTTGAPQAEAAKGKLKELPQ